MRYSHYYQAHVNRSRAWFFVATLRSYEYICFDRTLDVQNSIFEMFVAPDYEDAFLKAMEFYLAQGVVTRVDKLPNRLMEGEGLWQQD